MFSLVVPSFVPVLAFCPPLVSVFPIAFEFARDEISARFGIAARPAGDEPLRSWDRGGFHAKSPRYLKHHFSSTVFTAAKSIGFSKTNSWRLVRTSNRSLPVRKAKGTPWLSSSEASV